MPRRVVCRDCGVVLPGLIASCPSCGSRSGLRRLIVEGLAILLVLGVFSGLVVGLTFYSIRPRIDLGLIGRVQTYPGIKLVSADEKQTEVSIFIDNQGSVPVDVIVRVRGHDDADNVVAELQSERFRKIAPGESKTFKAILNAVPVEGVKVEFIELLPSQGP